MSSGLGWLNDYTGNEPLLPIVKKIDGTRLTDLIIGMRSDETWEHAVWRHTMEQRIKKINKIKEKIEKGS